MNRFKTFEQFITEKFNLKFADIFKVKNKWVDVDENEKKELSEQFYQLINIAYAPIGGHLKVKSAKDLIQQDWNVWQAIDFDSDPDAEVVVFGKRTPYGIKWAGVGHDGSKQSKKLYLTHKQASLQKKGNYGEVSEKLADILTSKGVPFLTDPQEIEKVLGKKIEFLGQSTEGHMGDGWYVRNIGGPESTKNC